MILVFAFFFPSYIIGDSVRCPCDKKKTKNPLGSKKNFKSVENKIKIIKRKAFLTLKQLYDAVLNDKGNGHPA